MNIVNFVDMPIRENSLLQILGITEDAEGLNVSEHNAWEWVSSTGSSSIIIDRIDLMTLSADCDEWFFTRLKFQNIDDYVYINDASSAGSTYTVAGVASESTNDALKMFKRIIDYEDSRVPLKITIHTPFYVDSDIIMSIYKNLKYYIDNPDDFELDLKNCRIELE